MYRYAIGCCNIMELNIVASLSGSVTEHCSGQNWKTNQNSIHKKCNLRKNGTVIVIEMNMYGVIDLFRQRSPPNGSGRNKGIGSVFLASYLHH